MRLLLLVVPMVCAGLAAAAPAMAQSSLGTTAPGLPPPQAAPASPPSAGGTSSASPPRGSIAPSPATPRPAGPSGGATAAPRAPTAPARPTTATAPRPPAGTPPSGRAATPARPPATGAPASRTGSRAAGAAAAGAAAGGAAAGAAALRPAEPAAPREPTPPRVGSATGMPLPRYAALGSNQVNLRIGPDLRYPIEWTYQRKDLPVQIIDEHQHWRRIRDPDGTEGWVQRPLLTSRRSFLVQGEERILRRRAEEEASPVARLRPGVIGRIRRCEEKQPWCEVQVGDYRGWLRRNEIWGVAAEEAVN